MKIPVDVAGGRQQDSLIRTEVRTSTRAAQAVGELGRQVGAIGSDMLDEQIRQKQATDRLAAGDYLLKFEDRARQAGTDIIGRLDRGEIASEDDALREYQETLAGIEAEDGPSIGALAAEDLRLSRTRVKQGLSGQFDGAMRQRRTDRAESLLASQFDALGKQVTATADIELLNMRADAAADAAIEAGVPRDRVDLARQNAKDRNWYNAATSRIVVGKDDMKALQALERDLVDEKGAYYQKLDAEKRNGLLAQVIGAQDRLRAKWEAAAAKRDSRAERALNEYRDIVASGFPVSDALRAEVASLTRGTSLEGDYVQAVVEERMVGEFLAKPVQEQQAYLVQRERELRTAGVSDRAELSRHGRLVKAFENNIKALTETPIEMNETRTGEEAPRLRPDLLLTPDGIDAATEILQDRVATIAAMRNQYGTVGDNPLTKDEAAQLGQVIRAMSPTERAKTLGVMAGAMRDPAMFKGAVRQMLGDDPRAFAAGMAHGMNLRTTEGRRLGDMIEQGSAILKDKSVIKAKATGSDGSRELFNQVIDADTIPVGSPDREMYYQSALAVYAKLAADEGRLGYELDPKLFRRAINLSTGGLIEVRGQTFVAPKYGMSDDEFTDKVNTGLRNAAKANGLQYGDLLDMRLVPDEAVPGRYYVKQDAYRYQPGRDGKPLFIEVR